MKFYFKRSVQSVLLLTGFFFLSLKLHAQSHIVEGYIIDAKTNEPVVNAVVSEKRTDNKALSDTKGFFSLRPSKPFPLTLVITSVGYTTAEEEVRSAKSDVSFYLSQNVSVLNEVVVVGYSHKKKTSPGDIIRFKGTQYNVSLLWMCWQHLPV